MIIFNTEKRELKMPERKDALLTLPVKRYLQRRVDKAGTTPELLPGEMELTRKFGVSRVTVRRAIQDLEELGYVIHTPGRRGLFTNPRESKGMPLIIGIVGGDRQSIFFDKFTAMILSGFIPEMEEELCQFEFISLSAFVPSRTQDTDIIRGMGIDALFWLIPEDEDIPLIENLIREHFPVITVNSPFLSDYRSPFSNCIGFDFAQKGKEWANFFLKQNLRSPIYCGGTEERFEAFRDTLLQNGCSFPDSHFIPSGENAEERLAAVFAQDGRIDGIVADGTFCQQTVNFLSKRPELHSLCVLLDASDFARKILKEHFELNLHIIEKTYYKTAVRTGALAAKMLRECFRNGGIPIRKRIMKWF